MIAYFVNFYEKVLELIKMHTNDLMYLSSKRAIKKLGIFMLNEEPSMA
jgi:hypothetical protein